MILNEQSRPKDCGVMWIPVRSSGRKEDVCLGMPGNYIWHYLDASNELSIGRSPSFDGYLAENHLISQLIYLESHPRDVSSIVNTGLFYDLLGVDFSEKKAYIEQNGISCLGMIVYIRGDVLKGLRDDQNLQVVRFSQDDLDLDICAPAPAGRIVRRQF